MQPTGKPYRYQEAKLLLKSIIVDFKILAGDIPYVHHDVSWQDVAGTAAANLHVLSVRLEAARQGNVADRPVVFPSPGDL